MLVIMSLWGRTRVGFGGGRGTVDVTTTAVFGAVLVALDVAIVVLAVLVAFVVVAAWGDEVAFVETVILDVVEAFDVVFAV